MELTKKTKVLIGGGLALVVGLVLLSKKAVADKANTANNTPTPNTPIAPSAPNKSIVPSVPSPTPITSEEQKYIDLNGFVVSSLITLNVIDPIRTGGAVSTQLYTTWENHSLKTNQIGWTRGQFQEVYKVTNTDGTFYYTIIPYVPEPSPTPD